MANSICGVSMKKDYVKQGHQDQTDPMRFVLSTADVDRMGDIVEQDWDLEDFRKNPIALYQHDSDLPIGTWDNVQVTGGKLIGELKLAEPGTSPLIDSVRSLVSQKILKAVSVGFSVKEAEPREKGGFVLKQPVLHEASLVSVPANANALAIAKKFGVSVREMKMLFPEVETDHLRRERNHLRLLKLSARQHA